MLSKNLQELMNQQIKNELYSAYLYLSMAAHFEAHNLGGFAHWMKKQSSEENSHAMKFYEFIFDRGGEVTLLALEQPPAKFESPLGIFKMAYEHEQKITGNINALYDAARKENDYPSQEMLNWFVKEQVEEEKSAFNIIEKLKLIGEHGTALYMLDKELGAR
jgi:ferritin